MKRMLQMLHHHGELSIGGYEIHRYDDGTMAMRHPHSVMSPTVKCNLAGLSKLFAWMDTTGLPGEDKCVRFDNESKQWGVFGRTSNHLYSLHATVSIAEEAIANHP